MSNATYLTLCKIILTQYRDRLYAHWQYRRQCFDIASRRAMWKFLPWDRWEPIPESRRYAVAYNEWLAAQAEYAYRAEKFAYDCYFEVARIVGF